MAVLKNITLVPGIKTDDVASNWQSRCKSSYVIGLCNICHLSIPTWHEEAAREFHRPIVFYNPRISFFNFKNFSSSWFGAVMHPIIYWCSSMPSTTGIRCGRCNKGFRSHHAKQQHVQDSENHHVSGYCPSPTDYETLEDLDTHLEEDHHICTTCNYRQFRDGHRLAQHDMDKHNICNVCRRRFQTAQNLKMVRFSRSRTD